MRYKDGKEAELGDIVRGQGFNLRYPAQGVVVWLGYDDDKCCTIHVATTVRARGPEPFEEHGRCAEFSLVYRAPGVTTNP